MKSAPGILVSVLALALASGCVTQVELARSAPDELLLVGAVSDQVVERFASEPGGERDDARLKLLYPAEGTELPENLAAMRFAWRLEAKAPAPKPEPVPMAMKAKGDPPPAETAYFELCLDVLLAGTSARFDAGQQTLCVYTDAGEVEIDAAHWSELVAAHQASEVTIRLRSLLSTENRLLSTAKRTLLVRSPVLPGALYYLEQDHAQLRRSAISSTSADDMVLPTEAPAAGYAISRDGKRMAFAPTADVLQVVSLPGLETLWSVSAPLSGSESASMAFDPTARRIAYARAGTLVLLDADNGALLPAVGAAASARISHPDWSPDGRYLAATLWPADAMPNEMELEGTSLVRLPVTVDGALGAPELLVSSSKRDETLAFPVHSRDGTWLAYMQLKGKLRDGKEARLWVVKPAGGSPTPLSASAVMPKAEELALLPAAPAWLPSEDPGLEWLAFVSQGLVAMKVPQLWLAPIHKPQLELGMPAGGPALWLPFQSKASPNLGPVFAQD